MAARRARQISVKECYDILRLQKGATLQDVKTAYRRRAFELHPDLHPGDAEASRQFQLLNEAYVALSAILKPAEEAKEKARKTSAETGASKEEKSAPNYGPGPSARERDASAAYAEQDVLRDLLNDPFARRVFEDIYSELSRKQAKTESPPPPPPPPPPQGGQGGAREPRKEPIAARPAPLESPREKGFKGAVKDFLRRQIDEKQTITMPAARLGPGAKIRLQIRKGMAEDVTAVDVTLPRDFVVGKPMRLRGLGKRLGPWQGDLYLTILTQ